MSSKLKMPFNNRILSGILRQAINRIDQTLTYIVLFIIFIIALISYSSAHLENWLANTVNTTTVLIFAAIGQTFVLLVQGIDFSIAGIIGITSCLSARFIPSNILAIPFIILMILIGVAAGFINGIFIVKLGIKPYIITFVTWMIYSGIAVCIAPQRVFASGKLPIFTNTFLNIPISFVLILIICCIWIYFRRTYFGVSLFAIETDMRAAYNAGLNVHAIIISAYILSGVFSAIAGVYITELYNYTTPNIGEGYIFLSLCASLIGGAHTTGGRGSILGTIAGCFILQLTVDLMVFWKVPVYWAQLLRSGFLVFMIYIQTYIRIKTSIKLGGITNARRAR